jgi:hypothetical protein
MNVVAIIVFYTLISARVLESVCLRKSSFYLSLGSLSFLEKHSFIFRTAYFNRASQDLSLGYLREILLEKFLGFRETKVLTTQRENVPLPHRDNSSKCMKPYCLNKKW